MRGYAHIGVLQALEESGIRPDVISGTSVGSVIGALYASGKSPDELWSIAQDIKIWSMVDFTISTESLMKGDKITDWMNGLVNDKSIEQFEIPYAAIATDMQAEKPVMITSGNTGFAIRASAAIPGIMAAVPYGSSELVDGGMTSMVPVRAAKKLGADVVIGVDIYCNSERYAGSDIPTVVLRVSQMQSCLISQQERHEADVLIDPYISLPIEDEEQAKEIAKKVGYDATMAQMDKIRTLIHHRDNGEPDAPMVTASNQLENR
ncbi:patatin-like phospholipase family protein [Providencia rettgeri]|uniref:Patatin-like phospholipase family protein n=2 Tax=Providencia rettgeri TaxID=587 RepID=A0AAE2Z9K4_PRORE|nr:patatin-like phospholipase family protein [Providencia rettgeri]NHN50565.1 patatin-like phospholipase family protein [Providencia rettgeri]